jgi:hypothetical protein
MSEEAPKKRTRKAPHKPFMVLAQVDMKDQPSIGADVWTDIETPPEIDDTAKALKYIEETENLPNGRYRVVQLCADQIKNVETITKTSMTPVEQAPADSLESSAGS